MSNSHVGLRAEALESLLIEKGLIQSDQIDQTISLYNERVGPMNGARVVAKAWKDPEYKNCLLYTSPSPRDLSTSRMPSSA